VTVLEGADVGVSAPVEESETTGGLSEFANDTSTADDDVAVESDTTDERTEGDRIEFTGTVVQTGDPAILDDGTETMTVDTTEELRLGEEVTARGEIVDGRLNADDVV
ncbi:MAG: replication factor A, partial [Salinirussus sp.]